jgi:hypothetical protein
MSLYFERVESFSIAGGSTSTIKAAGSVDKKISLPAAGSVDVYRQRWMDD